MFKIIKAHPVSSFFVLTVLISTFIWLGILLFLPVGGLVKAPVVPALILAALGGMVPSIMGITLTAVVDGKAGLQNLAERCKRLPDHPRLYLWLLLVPAINAAAYFLVNRFYPGNPSGDIIGRILPGIFLGLLAGLSEEFGWRGFALHHLQKKRSPWLSALVVGLVWGGVWHGVADYIGAGDMGWWFIPYVILVGPLGLTAFSFIMTRLYCDSQQSMVMMVLFHASISSSALIFGVNTQTPFDLVVVSLPSALMFVIAAALAVLTANKNTK